jgi:DNA-binding transcriptional ArsR family regulator
MPGDVDITFVASLLSDATRVNILLNLSDGRAFTASELAKQARVAPSTASAHLGRLVESSLLVMEKQGRYRYFRLANPAIVTILEELAVFAPATTVHSLREAAIGEAVRRARTCYNHLAGMLGVALTQALVEKQLLHVLEDGYVVSEKGECWLRDFGLHANLSKNGHSTFVPRHIDWSERRYHIAGSLAAALTNRLFELAWIKRTPASRAVSVTVSGRDALREMFGLNEF